MHSTWSLLAPAVVLTLGAILTSVACGAPEDPRTAIPRYSATLAAEPRDGTALVDRCAHYISLAQYEPAIADCTRALALQPNSIAALQNRATAYQRAGRLVESLSDWEQVLAVIEQDEFWMRTSPERIEYARRQEQLIRQQLEAPH